MAGDTFVSAENKMTQGENALGQGHESKYNSTTDGWLQLAIPVRQIRECLVERGDKKTVSAARASLIERWTDRQPGKRMYKWKDVPYVEISPLEQPKSTAWSLQIALECVAQQR